MQSNSRGAFGAIFGAIQSLMVTLIGLFKVADEGVAMLTTTVQDERKRQTIRSAADMKGYAANYVQSAAMNMSEGRRAVQDYRSRSAEHAASYDKAYEELMKAVNERLSEKKDAA